MEIMYKSLYASDAIEHARRAARTSGAPLVVARLEDNANTYFAVMTRAEAKRAGLTRSIVYVTDGS